MDLKIKDVAELLNVSEKTIRRWLADGKIPAYRLNAQYRFNRIEIENWVMACKLRNQPEFLTLAAEAEVERKSIEQAEEPRGGMQRFSLYRSVHKGGVFDDISGETKEAVIKNTVERISPTLGRDPEVLTELLLYRERLMPTALNHGIGLPHSRELVCDESNDVAVIVFPQRAIPYGALDGEPVHTLFFLFASGDKSHLHLLAKIANLASTQAARDFLSSRPSKIQALEYIRNWETSAPEFSK
jgi:PTS system nitrogen regulatory IIA component